MQKIIKHYDSFFDEDSGNTREEGLKQLKEYLVEDVDTKSNKKKDLENELKTMIEEINTITATLKNKKAVENNKKAVENNQNSFSILPFVSINSFNILRISFKFILDYLLVLVS